MEEYLYSAMEDFKIDIMIESGPNAQRARLHSILSPLLEPPPVPGYSQRRFARVWHQCLSFKYYDAGLAERVLYVRPGILRVPIHDDAASEIARRSHGDTRICQPAVSNTQFFVKSTSTIDLSIAQYATNTEVDKNGLDEMDNRILSAIARNSGSGPVGLTTITAVGEDAGTIEEVYEPFLIQEVI
ncbi:MAG: Holliday junction DNA helicase RuvB C-terminal domain-containing protein [Bacteroidales bacterium]